MSFLIILLCYTILICNIVLIRSYIDPVKSLSLNRHSSQMQIILNFIESEGERRVLLPTEYELALRDENLKASVLNEKWPIQRQINLLEKSWIQNELIEVISTEALVNEASVKFRKVILGVEKYRINNPALMARKYCSFIKTCLKEPDSWGVAANALEYAGLKIRDHVVEAIDGTASIQLLSLWSQIADRLLDLGQQSGIDCSSNLSKTWDQKYFAQIEMEEGGLNFIRNMMLDVMRIVCRAVLSRDSIAPVRICFTSTNSDPDKNSGAISPTYFPSLSSGVVVLASDFSIGEYDLSHLLQLAVKTQYASSILIEISNR